MSSRDSLNEQLPADLVASAEERVAIESETGPDRVFLPDIRIVEPPARGIGIAESPSADVEAPYRLLAQIDPLTERFIKIIEVGTERLVTIIEVVSPTNQRGEGLSAFRAKRAELLVSGVNFVEVDLNRSGDWKALLRPHISPPSADTPYRATFRIPSDPAATYLQPIGLRDRLPSISIPLRRGDPKVRIDLQALVDHAYSSGRYHLRLDYAKPCEPALEGDDASWAAELLRQAGKR